MVECLETNQWRPISRRIVSAWCVVFGVVYGIAAIHMLVLDVGVSSGSCCLPINCKPNQLMGISPVFSVVGNVCVVSQEAAEMMQCPNAAQAAPSCQLTSVGFCASGSAASAPRSISIVGILMAIALVVSPFHISPSNNNLFPYIAAFIAVLSLFEMSIGGVVFHRLVSNDAHSWIPTPSQCKNNINVSCTPQYPSFSGSACAVNGASAAVYSWYVPADTMTLDTAVLVFLPTTLWVLGLLRFLVWRATTLPHSGCEKRRGEVLSQGVDATDSDAVVAGTSFVVKDMYYSPY